MLWWCVDSPFLWFLGWVGNCSFSFGLAVYWVCRFVSGPFWSFTLSICGRLVLWFRSPVMVLWFLLVLVFSFTGSIPFFLFVSSLRFSLISLMLPSPFFQSFQDNECVVAGNYAIKIFWW